MDQNSEPSMGDVRNVGADVERVSRSSIGRPNSDLSPSARNAGMREGEGATYIPRSSRKTHSSGLTPFLLHAVK